MKNKIKIKKASGEIAEFSEAKLMNSLERAGADKQEAARVTQEVVSRLYEGIPTKKIYKLAFNILKGSSRPLAARYHLKRGIMELGPSGYPFEKFVAEVLRHQGYQVVVGTIVQGRCVSHEIDVIAQKNNHHFLIECKYHNQPGHFSDVKVPLYIQSRFKDVESEWLQLPGHSSKVHQGWVVTNTRFSTDAIQYGNCAGLKLLGWDYPFKDSLKELIDRLQLYPITCLTTLTRTEKQILLDRKIVLIKEICSHEHYLTQAGVNPLRIKAVLKEAHHLCQDQVQTNEH
jgi:Holliday junction resolvase-like predicted endonuclease